MKTFNLANRSHHPCFNYDARHKYARVHLPIAPKCNIQCKFCNRCFSCMNESRPGVSSAVLSPRQALSYLDNLIDKIPNISVAGIAGPGDAFAQPEKTLETLRLVKEKYPHLLFCLATNGLNVLPYAQELVDLGVSHITITVNAVDPVIGKEVYAWARDGTKIYRGEEAAKLLMERQLEAIERFSDEGVTVKVNAIVIPEVNMHHIEAIAQEVSVRGAHTFNCMPIYPVKGTLFEDVHPPTAKQIDEVRNVCKQYIHQMVHCRRCRADAAGLLSEAVNSPQVQECLTRAAAMPLNVDEHRPYIAVTSNSGSYVDVHLGQCRDFYIYSQDGSAFKPVERREAPAQGGGDKRWEELAKLLKDCHALVAGALGNNPMEVLTKSGIKVYQSEGFISDVLARIFNAPEGNARDSYEPTGCSGLGEGSVPGGCSTGVSSGCSSGENSGSCGGCANH